ncbi:hypothetical protein BJ138DRAFT_1121589 [Hygrophoropsis aurantiaca]|uniref:Uncharacterized protein n=1 Tax=Hygrophoropsis aurantiaca TaxID=72124 RepID=A0ACB8AU42_9AGAM|nr:hypothetical protein BJ138DRAFT_1121589 [Hygrophoropsis aurantiaca]
MGFPTPIYRRWSPISSSLHLICSVRWCFDDDPTPLITIGSQLKELDFFTVVADDRIYNVLRACPNLVKLSVNHRPYNKHTACGDVLLADLQILNSYYLATQGVVAPKLRNFAFKDDLTLYIADDLFHMIPRLSAVAQLKSIAKTPDPVLPTQYSRFSLTVERMQSCVLPEFPASRPAHRFLQPQNHL